MPLEVEYLLPVEPSACVASFKAVFDDHEIVGVVREKRQARKEYQKALKEGKMVALGEINELSRDIMVLSIGNLRPQGTVRIQLQFLQML